MGKLLVLFTVVPLLELYLLLLLGRWMGFWPTVAVVLVTALLGAALGKREGLRVWRSWRSALAQGRMPEEGILGGVLVLVGGILLITPGVLTDLTGLLLLMPPTRRVVARWVRARLEAHFAAGGAGGFRVVDLGGFSVAPQGPAQGSPSRPRVRRGRVVDVDGEVLEERRSSDREQDVS